jgi:putative tricarboxylic transport membrane protein
MKRFLKADRVAGLIFMALGALSLIEAYKILPLRKRGVAGDDTFLFLLGFTMLILGGCTVFLFKPREFSVSWPRGKAAAAILQSAAVMIAYSVLIPYLGYGPSTFLAFSCLLYAIGRYRWPLCLLSGAGLAVAFHFLFMVWLKIPFPIGLFGI